MLRGKRNALTSEILERRLDLAELEAWLVPANLSKLTLDAPGPLLERTFDPIEAGSDSLVGDRDRDAGALGDVAQRRPSRKRATTRAAKSPYGTSFAVYAGACSSLIFMTTLGTRSAHARHSISFGIGSRGRR